MHTYWLLHTLGSNVRMRRPGASFGAHRGRCVLSLRCGLQPACSPALRHERRWHHTRAAPPSGTPSVTLSGMKPSSSTRSLHLEPPTRSSAALSSVVPYICDASHLACADTWCQNRRFCAPSLNV